MGIAIELLLFFKRNYAQSIYKQENETKQIAEQLDQFEK